VGEGWIHEWWEGWGGKMVWCKTVEYKIREGNRKSEGSKGK